MSNPPTNDGRVRQDCPIQEIDTISDSDSELWAIAFTADGQHLVSGGTDGIRVWGVQDGRQVASMHDVQYVRCLATSKDGHWIAAGTWKEVVVWDATTYARVFTHEDTLVYFNGVDFASDSTRLVTASLNHTASVFDVARGQRVLGPLGHPDIVIAARYSPDGTRFATATPRSVRVYDNGGRILVEVQLANGVQVPPWYNTGLAWSRECLLVVSDITIKHIDASTGSDVGEWGVPDSNELSGIVLPRHGEYVAYATNRAVTVWDTSTHLQLAGPIEHPQDIRSIVMSPDDCFIAVAGVRGKVVFHSLASVEDLIPLPRLHPTFREPDIQIDNSVLDAWNHDELEKAETLLTATITSESISYLALASRALLQTRLHNWDGAILDAEQSIKIKPSVTGYVAKSIALVCKGEKDDGYRVCDIAFERFHSTHVSTVLLIKAIITFIAGDHIRAISRINDLIDMVHFNSICYLVQAYMYYLLGCSHIDHHDYQTAIQYFKRARAQVRHHKSQTLSMISLIFGWKFDDLGLTIRKHLCEAFYEAGRTKEGSESLLEMVAAVDEAAYASGPVTTWALNFVERCLSAPGDVTSHAWSETSLLQEWAKLKLTNSAWKDALPAAVGFTAPKSVIYRSICERLETLDQVTEATECFYHVKRTLEWEQNPPVEQAQWICDFEQRMSKKREYRGDVAADAGRYDEAISEYSAALSLGPASPQDLLVKRSKMYVANGSLDDALDDANEVIKLDPSSPWGYERKHAALHEAGNYEDAIGAFEAMLSKITDSPDPNIRGRQEGYVSPIMTITAIRKAVQEAIRDTPRVLINTASGHLLDKSKQASSFEKLPVFKEMISSMTTYIDDARIKQEVIQYYRYATFSHRWEDNEPLYDLVLRVVVYDLKESLTHDKLRTFCKIVRDAGFHWAWSDTCCINKSNHFVLQEALVSMFKWYEGSAMTIVYLRDIRSPAKPGDLVRSVWNMRAWTLQEYHASKVVRFYTEDWVPYMNLETHNHKDSPEIVSEMAAATGVSAQTLMTFRPGLDDIREKLCLASKRETTLVEDAAYSLLGVFSASLPIVYGERDKALGRLLAQLVTSSGDMSILAWTGISGSFNSCLPTSITVFSKQAVTHIPTAINHTKLEAITAKLNASSLNFTKAQELYERLSQLPIPMFVEKRMKLPCIMFKLGPLSHARSGSGFRAQTTALGVVEIKTEEDLSRLDSLYLIHPWIDFLLHRHPVGNPEASAEDLRSTINEVAPSPDPVHVATAIKRTRTFASRIFSRSPSRDAASLLPPSSESDLDRRTRVLHFVARLRQPFGALLFTPTRQNASEYKRVATDSTITVRVREDASFSALLRDAQTLDVL